ncbi:glycosyltransferase [Tessaracoccus defluvii]|uniref:Glycosyltransferase n=1 Tax=Tessaracoccus defluvii TaxID=1285901 RepID=A0A7H0H4S5_9ACTN|nr:glycosyltransferase [Tessaracoccus defluvii]QNP55541.1 glycosyltransferase [Tessaracoccus defluvii]
MRIVMVTDYYLPTLGGVQTLVKAHKEALERAGHTVVVACPLAEPSADPSVVALPISPVFNPDGYPFTWPYARTEQVLREALIDADIVHVHSEMIGAIAGLRVARELGIPIVQTMHGRIDVYTASVLPLPSVTTIPLAWLHRRRIPHVAPIAGGERFTSTRLARRMWRLMVNQANYADHVIVPSAHFAAKLRGQGVTSPLTVLSNGLEDSVLDQLTGARPRVPDGGLRVMWCGRVSPEKRPEVLIEALAQLPGSVTADLYGEGLALAATRRLIGRLGLAGRVRLHGAVPQSEVLAASLDHDVFVSTSYDFDNQPMVILEAIASGLPVVISDPDLGESIPDGGFVATAEPTATALAAELRRLLDTPERVTAMSRALLADAGGAAQQTHLDGLLAVYRGLLASRSNA